MLSMPVSRACEILKKPSWLQEVNSSERRQAMGWRWFSSTVRKNRPGVRSRLAKSCKIIRACSREWEFTAVRSTKDYFQLKFSDGKAAKL
jgi:hypothetical protein